MDEVLLELIFDDQFLSAKEKLTLIYFHLKGGSISTSKASIGRKISASAPATIRYMLKSLEDNDYIFTSVDETSIAQDDQRACNTTYYLNCDRIINGG